MILFFLAGCREVPTPPEPNESPASEVSYFRLAYQEGATFDFMAALKSVGTKVDLAVNKGSVYEIKVLVNPWRTDQVVVHKHTVNADSTGLVVGVYCSLAYSISEAEDAITIARDQEQIVLEVGNETFSKDVENWGYRPEAVTSKSVTITDDENPFIVMFHPNNMGGDDFDMAVKHAKYEVSYGEVACTIRRVK